MKMTATLQLPSPYLLFLGDTTEPSFAKTAFGLRDWVPERCVGEWGCEGATVTTGLRWLTPREAYDKGARGLVIGVANMGGVIGESWVPLLVEALQSGLDLVSGLHAKLRDLPQLRETAVRCGRKLIDVRVPPPSIPIGTGRKRTGKRLLTVGTDCALGKKYTALALARAFAERGLPVDFRATGQTGILIAGSGVSVDAVVSDFISGATEILAPANSPDHWDLIEGQGSLFHASYAGVSLGLLHGSQPDALVMCHEPTRTHMRGLPHYKLPSLQHCIDTNIAMARLTNPEARCVGISVNTSALDASAAESFLRQTEDAFGMPCVDPVRGSIASIVDRL